MIQTERELTPDLILELVEEYKATEVARLEMLQDYYDGKTKITEREMESGKPNNKTVLNYPAYIVDMITGYFIGVPIAYTSQESELLDEIQDIFNLNDEQDENSELATIMGTKGVAYELVYADEDANVRFNELDPAATFIVYDNSIIPRARFGIRFYTLDEEDYIELYTSDLIVKYQKEDDDLMEVDSQEHYFGGVPIVPYYNNKQRTSDFEKVISLIDAMETANSNSINDLEYFSDAYMYLVNMLGTDEEDIRDIRENKVILLDDAGEAGFLVKPSNNKDSEDVKDRLNQMIHKFARVPDMSDENFAANASGVAMAYKHFGLDQLVASKERKFQTGIYKRLELIINFINTKLGTEKYIAEDIKLSFSRNKPVNEKENAEIAKLLQGMVSDQTALSYLTMVEDPQDELERIENEKEAYPDYFNMDLGDEVDESEED